MVGKVSVSKSAPLMRHRYRIIILKRLIPVKKPVGRGQGGGHRSSRKTKMKCFFDNVKSFDMQKKSSFVFFFFYVLVGKFENRFNFSITPRPPLIKKILNFWTLINYTVNGWPWMLCGQYRNVKITRELENIGYDWRLERKNDLYDTKYTEKSSNDPEKSFEREWVDVIENSPGRFSSPHLPNQSAAVAVICEEKINILSHET